MIKSVVILGLMIVASYVRRESPDKAYKPKDTGKSEIVGTQQADNQNEILSAHIDRVEILCFFFGKHNDNSFRIFLSNSEFTAFHPYDKKETICVCRGENKNRLIQYVNRFYIDKTDKIILNRTKRSCIKSADYPYIKVIGYRNKKEVSNVETQIGESIYNIEFNPKFLEFYEFLGGLVEENPNKNN